MNKAILSTWRVLNLEIGKVTEKECWELLEHEKNNGRRVQVMLRLFGHANKLRTKRERGQLLKGAK